MSVRQYIGARYVTKIYENTLDPSSAEWQASVNYEPLTMVTYNNGSYLSKKQVPASIGNPAANPAYWVQTGFYNGQIAQLQNDVSDLQIEVNTMNSPTFRNMSERKFVFVGDSYTQVPTPSTSFVGNVAFMLGLSSDQYHNIGVSGDGMDGFINQVNNYAYTDADEITDVVVTGGINDAQGMFISSDLNTKIPALITAITTKFPNAIIWAGFSGNGYYTNLSGTYPGFTYDNVQNIKYLWEDNFAKSSKVIYMDKLDEWCRTLLDTDYYETGGSGLHPMDFGIAILSEKIANFLKGGPSISPDLTAGSQIQIAFSTPYDLWTGVDKLTYTRQGSNIYVKFSAGGANLTSAISLSASSPLTLLEEPAANSNAIVAMREAVISTPLFYMVTGDSTFHMIMAYYVFTDQQVKVYTPTAINPITDVVSLWYPALEFVLPANAT